MLVSSPLCEKRQMSAVEVPLAGRCSAIGLPPSVHVLLSVMNSPSAATFRSRSLPGTETPAVVGSTTMMSFPVAAGALPLSEMISSDTFGVATISAAGGYDLNRIGSRRGAWRRISSTGVDRSANARSRASRALHLPNNILVTGSQHRRGEALHRQRGQRDAPGQHGHEYVIDHRD